MTVYCIEFAKVLNAKALPLDTKTLTRWFETQNVISVMPIMYVGLGVV
jgi:hypothetical protein